MEGVLPTLERLVFEEYLTVTPALLTTLVPSIDAPSAKSLLARFAELNNEKLETLFLVTKRLSDGRTVLSKTADVTDVSNFVSTPVVYQVRMRGSMETATAIEKRISDSLLKKIADVNTSLDSALWRNPLAVAVSSTCERRPVRAPLAPASAPKSGPAKNPVPAFAAATPQAKGPQSAKSDEPASGKAKPTTITSAFAKAASAPKRPVEETKSASVVSVSSATAKPADDEEEEVTMQQRSRKRQRIIEDEPEQKPAPSVSQAAASVISAETVNADAVQEPDEYKIKKKVTVTQISLSENGYMEVEDVQQMQEQIVKKSEIPKVEKPASQPSRPPTKPAPSGQRTLMDMFKKK